MSSIRYIPAIDGLRTLAILPVILFHLGLSWMPGGFVGVDVFFVISGYLISSIILDECQRGTFRFADFWQRRVRRILPALLTMIVVTLLAGYSLRYGRDVEDLGLQGLAAIVSLANVCLWQMAGDYWGVAAEHSLLLHTWSLSVEEQFYLFFPLFLFLLVRYASHHLLLAVVIMTTASFGLYVSQAKGRPDAVFYLLPARIWELAAGALLAIWFSARPMWKGTHLHAALALVGMFLLLLSCATLTAHAVVRGGLLLPVVATALILLDQHNTRSLLNRCLASPPMVMIGKLSYSLYLWHWPVIVLAKEKFPDVNQHVLNVYVLLGTVLLSLLSFYFIEKKTRQRAGVVRWILLATIGSLGLSAALYFNGKYHDVSQFQPTVWRGPLYDVAPAEQEATSRWQREGLTVMQPSKPQANAYVAEGIVKRYGPADPDVVVIGDSLSLAVAGLLDDMAREKQRTIAFYSARGTPVFPEADVAQTHASRFFSAEQKRQFDQARLQHLRQWRPAVVIIAGKWSVLQEQGQQDNAQAFVEWLAGAGSHVVLLEQPPELAVGDITLVQYLVQHGVYPVAGQAQFLPMGNTANWNAGNAFIRQLAASCAYCEYLPLSDLLVTADGSVRVLEGDAVLYRDDDHLSEAGAGRLRLRLQHSLDAVLPAQ